MEDLIYTNLSGVEEGILVKYDLDHEISATEGKNTFQLKVGIENKIEIGSFIYANGTEYGGRITKLQTDTSKKIVTYTGSTWLGMLEQKLIVPDTGHSLIVSGDLNQIIAELITRCTFDDVFDVSTDTTINVNYEIPEFITLFSAIKLMLAAYKYKLVTVAQDGRCTLSAVPITDFDDVTEVNSDMFDFKLTKQKYTTNHLIAVGIVDDVPKYTIHKYIDRLGNVSDTQFFYGKDEVVAMVEESVNENQFDEFIKAVEEELLEMAVSDGLSITANNLNADLGDKITAEDINYGISVTQYVIDKIITLMVIILNINTRWEIHYEFKNYNRGHRFYTCYFNDDGCYNQAVWGKKSIILKVGEEMKAAIIDNNTIQISDGDLLLQGRHARINPGTTENVTIGTGTVGTFRNDLIVARYVCDTTTGYENITLKVIEGAESAGSAVDPAFTEGDIRTGALLVDFPLYRVKLDGINISAVELLADIVTGFQDSINEINENLTSKVDGKIASGSYTDIEGISYDETNKKLMLKVAGADTPIPFSGGGIVEMSAMMNPVKNTYMDVPLSVNINDICLLGLIHPTYGYGPVYEIVDGQTQLISGSSTNVAGTNMKVEVHNNKLQVYSGFNVNYGKCYVWVVHS